MTAKKNFLAALDKFNRGCLYLKPLGDLFIRFWIFQVFFLSGLAKVTNWSSTLLLFQFEYHIPFIPSGFAAFLAAAIELGVSSLLLLGLGGRIPALILFLFNICAVASYPFLWTPAGEVGLHDHFYWGLLLLILLLHGTGNISCDYFLRSRNYTIL